MTDRTKNKTNLDKSPGKKMAAKAINQARLNEYNSLAPDGLQIEYVIKGKSIIILNKKAIKSSNRPKSEI